MTADDHAGSDRPDRYPVGLRRIHWLMAALLPAMVVLGLFMGTLPRGHELKILLLNWHLMLGCAIFLLALLRIAIRLKSRLPEVPSGYSALRTRLVSAVHIGFYLIMLGLPVLGICVWAIDPFVGGPAVLGEAVCISNLAGALHRIHYLGAWLLCGLLIVHIIGALGKKAGNEWTIRRML